MSCKYQFIPSCIKKKIYLDGADRIYLARIGPRLFLATIRGVS
jgi:hypothetical protein